MLSITDELENLEKEGFGRIGVAGRLKRCIFYKCHPEMLKDLIEVLRKCEVDMARRKKLYGDLRELDEGLVQAVRESHFQKELLKDIMKHLK